MTVTCVHTHTWVVIKTVNGFWSSSFSRVPLKRFVPSAAENNLYTHAGGSLERTLPTASAWRSETHLKMGPAEKPQASVGPQNIRAVASAESEITFSSGKCVISNYSTEWFCKLVLCMWKLNGLHDLTLTVRGKQYQSHYITVTTQGISGTARELSTEWIFTILKPRLSHSPVLHFPQINL